ncbi:MAG: serine hydrolase [Ruminiclostridium sp.]|nr:serine hydrolase [Ruminiclostridium sp.]
MKKMIRIAAAFIMSLVLVVGTVPSASAASSTYYIKILSKNINIRSGPGTKYKLIGKTGGAGSFNYLGAQFDDFDILWYKIEDGKSFTGWVSSDVSRRYLKKAAKPKIPLPEEYESDGTVFSDIEKVVYDTAQSSNAIGVQVAAIRGSDGRIFDWTYGYSKYGEKDLGNATKIRAASVSKVAIAICALQMEEQGMLDINKKISLYWGKKMPKAISLATLLTHTSTLRYLSMQTDAEKILEQLTDKSSYIDGKVGSSKSWMYNNYGTSVAAATLDVASGMVLEDFAQENLFKPLGVDMSFFAGNIEKQNRLATLYEADHGVELLPTEAKYIVPDGEPGHNSGNYIGGLTGSARDIAKMLYMLANDGKYKKQQILTPESVEKIEKRYFSAEEYGGKFKQSLILRYGADRYGTKGVYYHTGNAYGVIALASYDPETKNTVIVLTTGASHERDDDGVYKVCSDIADAVYRNIDNIEVKES